MHPSAGCCAKLPRLTRRGIAVCEVRLRAEPRLKASAPGARIRGSGARVRSQPGSVTGVDGAKWLRLGRSRRSLFGAMLPIPAGEQLLQAGIRDPSPEPLAIVFRSAAIAPLPTLPARTTHRHAGLDHHALARSACLLAVRQPGYRHGADGGAPVIGGNRGHLISNTASKAQMLAVANSSVRHRNARVGTRASWPAMYSRLLSIRAKSVLAWSA